MKSAWLYKYETQSHHHPSRKDNKDFAFASKESNHPELNQNFAMETQLSPFRLTRDSTFKHEIDKLESSFSPDFQRREEKSRAINKLLTSGNRLPDSAHERSRGSSPSKISDDGQTKNRTKRKKIKKSKQQTHEMKNQKPNIFIDTSTEHDNSQQRPMTASAIPTIAFSPPMLKASMGIDQRLANAMAVGVAALKGAQHPLLEMSPVSSKGRKSPPRERMSPVDQAHNAAKHAHPLARSLAVLPKAQPDFSPFMDRPKTASALTAGTLSPLTCTQGQGLGLNGPISNVGRNVKELQSPHSQGSVDAEHVDSAERVWNSMVGSLREVGAKIKYKDLAAMSDLHGRDAPPDLVAVVSYVSVLLGLAPNWQAAKRSLFKELVPLQKFLQEVALDSLEMFLFVA